MARLKREPLAPADGNVPYETSKLPTEVGLINQMLDQVFKTPLEDGFAKNIGGINAAVYAFFDYDGEPIYVGQTRERVGTRVRRHLTGMRSDSVAKFVLDPFEVRYLSVWPLSHVRLECENTGSDLKAELTAYEATVYYEVLRQAEHKAVLNEGTIRQPASMRDLPVPLTFDIIPAAVFHERSHPDIRMARRAQTIANLARHISERDVSTGLRQALDTQSKRLATLSQARLAGLGLQSGVLAFQADTQPLEDEGDDAEKAELDQ